MSDDREEILILYGTQTGNSEAAAQTITRLLPQKTSIPLKPKLMQCDDLFYVKDCQWTRFVIIVTSSYGVGQAPLGCQRFREFCDFILSPATDKFLQPVTFFLLGLGDSQYRTFFKNPTRIDEALQFVGATRAGVLGKADASGVGKEEQEVVIERWIEGLWMSLEKAFAAKGKSSSVGEELGEARRRTKDICTVLFPDFPPVKEDSPSVMTPVLLFLSMLAMVVAIRIGMLDEAMERYWRWYDGY